MMNEANNSNFTNSSPNAIQSRLVFLKQKEIGLSNALELGKQKEQEMREKLMELQQRIKIIVKGETIPKKSKLMKILIAL